MPNNSMLSLKYSWLGAGIFALFSIYVAVSGVGVSSVSKDARLAGSVSINPNPKQASSYSFLSPNSILDTMDSVTSSSTSKAVVEVALLAPVAKYPPNSGVQPDNVSQAEATLESSKSTEGNHSTTTTLTPRSITSSNDFRRLKDRKGKGVSIDKTRSKVKDNRVSSSSSTTSSTSTTTISTSGLSDGSSSNPDN